MDILFIKLGALGDVINTLPLAVALQEQLHARIHWLVEPLSYPLVAEHPSVSRAMLFNKKQWLRSLPGVISQIRHNRFDIVLDLQRLIKSGIFCMASNCDRRIGFDRERCKEFTWLLPFERIPADDPTKHMAHQYMDFARYLGADPQEIKWDIPLTGKLPIELPKEYVILNIGATASSKRWTAEGFASLVQKIRKHHDIACVLTGGPDDISLSLRIDSLSSGQAHNLVGKTSLLDLKEIIAGARAMVTCDTGPMHLAVALGKEVITLIGPTNPKRTGPLKGRIVKQDLDCMPCNKRQCDNPVCLTGLSAEPVLDALDDILK
jgi:ADP-heptose:LPS heptosyltransferase